MSARARRRHEHVTTRHADAAIGLSVVYLALAFGWRTWQQWRTTGDSGFRLSRSTPTQARVASALMVGGAAAGFAGSLRARRRPRRVRAGGSAGLALMAISTAITVRAQRDMGRSWRIGVDDAERTELVTDGVFRLSRNPIFASMGAFAAGSALAAPGVLTGIGAGALLAGVEVQVRRVEEPYLDTTHGDAYRSYCALVGRFLPGIGRISPRPRSAA